MENDFDSILYNLPPIGGFHDDYDDHYDDYAMGGFHNW